MATVTNTDSAYGAMPAQTAGASRTTVQSPFSDQVTAGRDFRKSRLQRHRLNRTIQTTATAVVVSGTVAQCTDAVNTVRFADRIPATLVNGKRTGRIRRVAKGAIATLNTLVGGSGYTNASYTNIPLVRNVAGNRPLGGAAADITVSGGAVTACTLVAARNGEGYTVGEVLTAQAGLLGAGTGFTITVATIDEA
jgi:hypothetical protein